MGKTYDIMMNGPAINQTIAMYPFTWFPEENIILPPLQMFDYCSKLIQDYENKIYIINTNNYCRVKQNLIDELKNCDNLNSLEGILQKYNFIVNEINQLNDELDQYIDMIAKLKVFQTFLTSYLNQDYFAEISY